MQSAGPKVNEFITVILLNLSALSWTTHSQPPCTYPYTSSHTCTHEDKLQLSLTLFHNHTPPYRFTLMPPQCTHIHMHTQTWSGLHTLKPTKAEQESIPHQSLSSTSHHICQPAVLSSRGYTRELWELWKQAAKKKNSEDRRVWDRYTWVKETEKETRRRKKKCIKIWTLSAWGPTQINTSPFDPSVCMIL